MVKIFGRVQSIVQIRSGSLFREAQLSEKFLNEFLNGTALNSTSPRLRGGRPNFPELSRLNFPFEFPSFEFPCDVAEGILSIGDIVRPELAKVLMDACDRKIALALPEFNRVPSKPSVGFGRLYSDTPSKPVVFLFFQVSDKRDAFTVELAWSDSGAFPALSDYPVPRDWPDIGVVRGDHGVTEFRFRLSKLWVKPKYDPWWEFAPPNDISRSGAMSVLADQRFDDTAQCDQLIDDAIRKILNFGCTYIREIRARKPHRGMKTGTRAPRE